MGQAINRKRVAEVSKKKCLKRYGRGEGRAGGSACEKGVDFAHSHYGIPGSIRIALENCSDWNEYGDPDQFPECRAGVALYQKGIKDIGPRLAGPKKKKKRRHY